MNSNDKALEARARRAAKSVDLRAIKSRNFFIPNQGRFQLVNKYTGEVEAGREFELSAEDVLDFCYKWQEERKFALGASGRYDLYLAGPAKDPIIAAKPAKKPAKVAPAEPAQLEPGGEVRSSQAEVELEKYRKWGFNDPKDLEVIPRPAGIFTFAEVCQEFGFKTDRGVYGLAERSDYPPLALEKRLIVRIGCDLLKAAQQQEHIEKNGKRRSAYEHTKKKRQTSKPTRNR
jgi:hypothetical protein